MLSVPPHGAVHLCALRLLGEDPRCAFASDAHQPQAGRILVLVHATLAAVVLAAGEGIHGTGFGSGPRYLTMLYTLVEHRHETRQEEFFQEGT